METKQSLIPPSQPQHNTEDTFISFMASGSRHRRRSSSFSSISTLSSDSPLSPKTILQTGVPFSWEKLPGIPKYEPQKIHRKKDGFKSTSTSASKATALLLPPPPTARLNRFSATDPNPRNKKTSNSKHATLSKKDPFLAAFVVCCKDDENHHHQGLKNLKMSPTIHRLGLFSPYAICKTSGPVSESIVFIPKSNSLF